jgi:acetyl-CoA C-acetyltransferase
MGSETSYIVAAKRSPIGKLLGGLSRLRAAEIGAQVVKAMMTEAKADPEAVTEVYLGQVLQAGAGQNPARQVALGAGLPPTVAATTVNKVCGSGLQSIIIADMAVRAGAGDLFIAGGIESMSQAPYLLYEMRGGAKFGHRECVDSMLYDGLINVYDNTVMGLIAEETAEKGGITRERQDEYAVRSHQRAAKADADGFFDRARVPIEIKAGKPPFNMDETIRADASIEAMASLRPAFKPDGTITAGNASAISDGAATLLIASQKGLGHCGAKPMARIIATTTAGAAPHELFFTPIQACRDVCEMAGWDMGSIDLWELNEAFAAQMLVCLDALELDQGKVNVYGGAISLGHPIGASGGRVLGTLVHGLAARGGKRGVAALCLGGGNAVAVAVETC